MKTDIDTNFSFDLPKNRSNVMKVMGIGGGGSNAVNYMYNKGIRGVDFVVCNTRDKDLGTIFEAGFSYASNVPIIYYAEGLQGNFNLMLSRSGRAVATNVSELKDHVKGIMENPEYEKEYVGFVE